jgi:hypothetical protein
MKRYLGLILMVLVLVSLFSMSALALTNSKLVAPKISKAPTIDGKLDDEAWKGVEPVDLAQNNQGAKPGLKIQAWVAYDDENLYIAFKNYKGKKDIVANFKIDGQSVFQDDSNEVFIDPAIDGKGVYYQFAVNSLGTRWHGIVPSSGGLVTFKQWEAKAAQYDDHWIVEYKIPFSTIRQKTPAAGAKWGLNLCGNSTARSGAQEHMTWSTLKGPFHQPTAFGMLEFGK